MDVLQSQDSIHVPRTFPSQSESLHETTQREAQSPEKIENAPEYDDDKNNKVPSWRELGVLTARPKRPEYGRIETRLDTFGVGKWPHDFITPKELAEAGFFYTDNEDCVRCFFCGGGLKNWEEYDNPWVEHARFFSRCGFLEHEKGSDFIDAVKEVSQENESNITIENVKNKMKKPLDQVDFKVDVEPAVKTLIDLGHDKDHIFSIASTLPEKYHSSTELYKILHNVPINSKSFPMTEESERFDRENYEISQRYICLVCKTAKAAVVILPCGHLVCCFRCSTCLTKCPLSTCQGDIKAIVHAKLPKLQSFDYGLEGTEEKGEESVILQK